MSRAWKGRIATLVIAAFAVLSAAIAGSPVILALLPLAALAGIMFGRRFLVPQAIREAPTTARLGGAGRAASVAWMWPLVAVLGLFVIPRLGLANVVLFGTLAVLVAFGAGGMLAIAQSEVPALLDRLNDRP